MRNQVIGKSILLALTRLTRDKDSCSVSAAESANIQRQPTCVLPFLI